MRGVATSRTHTIGELTRLLEIPRSGIAKAVFVVATMGEEERSVFAVVRGDMELNETKLANAVWGRAAAGAEGRDPGRWRRARVRLPGRPAGRARGC